MANYVFHFDRWWNPAVENQAVDRVYRIGQKLNTFVYKFICKGTLEERIDELIESKIKLSDGIIPKGDSIISELTEKEFIKLIKRM
jgi:SNF2 family DNA or RNA helicase